LRIIYKPKLLRRQICFFIAIQIKKLICYTNRYIYSDGSIFTIPEDQILEEEKSLLQSIKLEISRTFKLVPYERLSFHSILGILKSEIGMSILLRELEKGPVIRRSAVAALIKFDAPQVLAACMNLLKANISDEEKIMILSLVKRRGGRENLKDLMDFISGQQEKQTDLEVVIKAYDVIKAIGADSEEVLKFLISNVNSESLNPNYKSLSVESLSSFKSIDLLENILKRGDDALCYAVYKALYLHVTELNDLAQELKTDDDRLFTYSPDSEDKIILEIRVLLGKMTSSFDSYSNKTKIAFISAMISCNHREHLIYIMKALTSNDVDLVSMVLYSLYQNVVRLRDPDKLFRNLIAISTEINRFNELIIDIFIKYFSKPIDSRVFHLFKDKLFSYIVVTLESYFETYRKDFMITDVIEKGLPESFQRIRKFILNNCTPELKKEIIVFLENDNPSNVMQLVAVMSKKISSVDESSMDDLGLFIEMLLEKDKKSRDNSSERIGDLNFEKLYLRNRIIRLCRIVGLLKINEAASALVNIYNYLKKYPDREIFEAAVHTLSMLNYSYMLGEIEIMITTGNDEERKNALNILSLFTEQRSLNILLEYLKNHIGTESDMVWSVITILLERDIGGNITANQIFKGIISSGTNAAIRSLAVLGIGQCGFDSDIDYLNALFHKMGNDEAKDVIVRAIAGIIIRSASYNKRQLIRYLQDYLKDPGIKVRIYSCLLLIHLGSREALRSIREMLVIKNKVIQRDILMILGELKSIEFSFFLISLLKEEYGISKDIIPVISKLPVEDKKEIDGFVVNIFRKFEAPTLDGLQTPQGEMGEIPISGIKKETLTIANIRISEPGTRSSGPDVEYLIDLNLRIKSMIASTLMEHGGVISKMSYDNSVVYFDKALSAAQAMVQIAHNVNTFNSSRTVEKRINVNIFMISDTVDVINDEILEFPLNLSMEFRNLPLENKIIIDGATREILKDSYSMREIPRFVISTSGHSAGLYELLSPINFLSLSDRIIKSIKEDFEKRELLQKQIEDQLKTVRLERRSPSSMVITRKLDTLGVALLMQLNEIDRYVQKRSTDRELIKNVRKMLTNIHNYYMVEISRTIVD
jgi:HEAT repeat protein